MVSPVVDNASSQTYSYGPVPSEPETSNVAVVLLQTSVGPLIDAESAAAGLVIVWLVLVAQPCASVTVTV